MSNLRPLLIMVATGVWLAGCAPPDPQIISQCRLAAIRQAKGHAVDSSDAGELIEACMMTKGFAVQEDGPGCEDDTKGPFTPACYYPDTMAGRFGHLLRRLL